MNDGISSIRLMRRKSACCLLIGLTVLGLSVSSQAARYSLIEKNDDLSIQAQDPWVGFQMPDHRVMGFEQQGYRFLSEAISLLGQNNISGARYALQKARQLFLNAFHEKSSIVSANGLIKVALLRKDYKEAEKWGSRAFEISPDNPETLFLRAKQLIDQKAYKAAEDVLHHIVKKNDTYKAAFLALAEIAAKTQKLTLARKHLEHVLTLDSSIPSVYVNLAKLYNYEQRLDKALDVLQQGYNTVQNDPAKAVELATVLAQFYVKANKPRQALILAREVYERYPYHQQALNIYLDTLVINGNQNQAESLLKEKIKENPADVNFKRKLVLLLQNDEARQADVIALFKDIVAEKDKNAVDYATFFNYLIKIKQFDGAKQIVADVRRIFPGSNIADVLQAEWFLAKNEINKSAESYMSVYKKTPNNNLLVKIVETLIASGQKTRAIKFLKDEIKQRHSVAAKILLAGIYLSDNEIAKAEAEYRSVLKKNPDHYIALNDLAWLLGQHNRVKEALPLAKKAYSIAPGNPDVVDTYVKILKKMGLNDKAQKVAAGQPIN